MLGSRSDVAVVLAAVGEVRAVEVLAVEVMSKFQRSIQWCVRFLCYGFVRLRFVRLRFCRSALGLVEVQSVEVVAVKAGLVDVVGHYSGPGCWLEWSRLLQSRLHVGAVEVDVGVNEIVVYLVSLELAGSL